MNKNIGKKYWKAVVAFAIVLALVLPGSAVFANIEETTMDKNNMLSSNDVDISDSNKEYQRVLDDATIGDTTIDDDTIKEIVETSGSSTDWWPMFRHDLGNTGYSTSTAPNTNTVLWSYNNPYGPHPMGSAAVVDGRVYFGSSDKNVYCLNAYNGVLIWKYTTDGMVIGSCPSVVDGKVYIGSRDYVESLFYCLDASDGSFIWSFATGGDVVSSPTVFDGKVYISSRGNYNTLYCLNASDGSLIWSIPYTDKDVSPAIYDGKLYFASNSNNKVYCLNAQNGSEIWSYTAPSRPQCPVSVVDGRVYSGGSDHIWCLNASDGSEIWNYPGVWIAGCPSIAYERVFFGDYHGDVYCLDATNGSFIWSYPTGDDIHSSPSVADGKVFIGSYDNYLHCIDAMDGSLIWNYDTSDHLYAVPAIADGRVYFGSGNGVFYCFESADTIVSIEPLTQDVEKGEVFTVDVSVEPGEPPIGAMTVNLSFNSSLVHAVEVTEGDLFDGINTSFISGIIDNVAGTITLISVVTIPLTGVSDPGVFCRINFTAQQELGTSPLDLEGVEALDEFGSSVSIVVNDGFVIVGIPDVNWPMKGHDPERTGYSTSLSAPDTNNLLWSYTTQSPVTSSPAVADGRVFVSSGNNIYCLDSQDGSLIWGYDAGASVVSSPTVADGKVYVGSQPSSGNGYLYCLDASDGSLIWSYSHGGGYTVKGSPVVVDGKVFFVFYDDETSDDDILYCLNALDGSVIWRYTVGVYPESSRITDPAVADGKVFIGSYYYLHCLDTQDGSIIWSYYTDTPSRICESASPIVANGKVYFGTSSSDDDCEVRCLNVSDGSLIWSYFLDDDWSVDSLLSIAYGKIFVSIVPWHKIGMIICLDASDGSFIWNFTADDSVGSSSAAVADGKIYFGSTDFNVYCLDAMDGSFIWSYYTGGEVYSSPAVADGKVYIGSLDNNIYCFGLFLGHDVGIHGIDSPVTGLLDVVTPEILVVNAGVYNETNVPVNLQIIKTGTGNVEYNETVNIASIDSEEIKVVTFPDWMPEDLGMSSCSVKYNIVVCTQLTGDENPGNDGETKNIALYPSDTDWWSKFRHDLNNSGYSTSRGPETNNMLWSYIITFYSIKTSPTVAEGKVFFSTTDDKLYCLDAFDGSFIWRYITDDELWSPPAVADGKVYFGSDNKNLYCLNAMDGSFIWSYYTDREIYSSPAVADGKVYTGAYCLDAQDGSLIWSAGVRAVHSSPAVVDGKVYIGAIYGEIHCLDASDGSVIWRYQTGGYVKSSPAVADGKVYVSSGDCNLYCLDAQDGSLIWSHYIIGTRFGQSSPAVADGKVFIGSQDKNIYCLDAMDGSEIWRYRTVDVMSRASPAVADGKVYIGVGGVSYPRFYCLDIMDGSLIWDHIFYAGGMMDLSPAIADGKVYVGTSGISKMYCFGPPDHDTGVASIDSPVSGPADVFTPEVTVRNFGFNNEIDVPINMQIDKINNVWTEVLFSGTGHWEQYDYASDTYHGGGPSGGTGVYFARAISERNYNDVFEVGLITPPLDLSGLSSVTLEFEMNFDTSSTDWAEVNAFSGEIGVNLATYTSFLDSGHKTIIFDPSGYVDPSEVYIEFYYSTGDRTNQGFISIDDVSINEIGFSEGFEIPIFPPVEVESIPEYNETINIDIDIGETKVVMFPDWTPDGSDSVDYRVTAGTQLIIDGEPRNDLEAEVITLDYGYREIIMPSSLCEEVSNDAFDIDDDNMKEVLGVDWWPMFHHDQENTGYSTSITPNKHNLFWIRGVGHSIISSPSVVDGRIYFGSHNHHVYCLDATDGSIIWRYQTGGYVKSSPAVADGKVYVGSNDQKFYCLDASDGSFIWSKSIMHTLVTSSPTVADGKVYIDSYCFDATDGSTIWHSDIEDISMSSPAVADGRVFIGSLDNNIYCLDATDGSIIWSYQTGDYVKSSPAVVDGKVFVGSQDSNLYCLDAQDGSLIWKYTTGNKIRSSPAVAYGNVYFGSYDEYFYCLDATDGSLIWKERAGFGWSSPAVADGKVFLQFRCLDAMDGSLLWSYDANSYLSSPAIADGKVYIASSDHNIYCYGIYDHDFGVNSINSPFGGVARIFTPEAVVENYGRNNEADVPVNMEITRFVCPNFSVEYNKTVHVDIDGLEDLVVMFPDDWTPDNLEIPPYGFIRYRATACSQILDDGDPDDDRKIKVFSLTTGEEDITPPVTTHEFDPLNPNGENDWHISDVTITLTATDDISGIDITYYRIDSGDWDEYHNHVVVSDDGEHTLEYYSIDNAENIEEIKGPFDFKIDQTSPEIDLNITKIGFRKWLFNAIVNDITSGINRVEFYYDDEPLGIVTEEPYEWEYSGSYGENATAVAYDNAGNSVEDEKPVSYSLQNRFQEIRQTIRTWIIKILSSFME